VKRTVLGLSAMSFSLICGTIISLGSLVAMRGQLDSEVLTQRPFSLPSLLVSCLDPLAVLMEIVALVLIVRDSRRFGAFHRHLTWAAVGLYTAWAAANVLGFLPLSLISAWSGSRSSALAGQWIKAIAALLAYLVPALLVFGLSPRPLRIALGLGLFLSVIGSFGVIALSIAHLELEPIAAAGQTLHVAKFNIDYTRGLFPVLMIAGQLGGALYLAVYACLVWMTRHEMRSSPALHNSAAA
jgi:hypothetical protein